MNLKSLFLCLSSVTTLVEGNNIISNKSSFIPRATIGTDVMAQQPHAHDVKTCKHKYTYKYTATSEADDPILIDGDISTSTASYWKVITLTRGGAYYNGDYDEYDAYYDDDDNDLHDDHYDERATNRRPNRYSDNNGNNNSNRRPPPNRRQPPPRPRPPQSQSPQRRGRGGAGRGGQYNGRNNEPSSTLLSTTADIAQKSLNVATSATLSTLKTSGRAAYYLTAPKHVQKHELYGIWRFDQSIGESVCAANIEFTLRGDAVTRYAGGNGKDNGNGNSNNEDNVTESVSGYLFQSKSWPRSCSIEFEAEAFQGVEDARPVRYYYKGYFRRKMADKSVIKIVGKIYEVKKRFWKGKDGPGVAGVEVGSFVARKRMQANRDDIYGGEEEYDDDYDDYDDDYGDFYDDHYDSDL